MLLRLLLVCVALYAARADTPSILTVNTNDPDDNDRTYSNGDAITLFIATEYEEKQNAGRSLISIPLEVMSYRRE